MRMPSARLRRRDTSSRSRTASIEGGAGEGVLEELSREGLTPKTLVLGIDDQYVHQGKPDLLMHDLGLDAEGIAASVRALMD